MCVPVLKSHRLEVELDEPVRIFMVFLLTDTELIADCDDLIV